MTPPSPAAARRPRSAWKIGAVALALLLALGLGWRAHDRRSQVQAYVPARPAGAVLSPALAERLTAAESRARGWWQPAAGIAELGRLYHANGHAAEAAWCYTGAREVAPTEALWPHLLASLLAGAGRLEEALPLWREAVRLDPDYEPARLRLGDVLLKSNQAAEAARVYEAVLARTAHQPYALLGLARCRLSVGDWTGARELLVRARQQHPDFVGALTLLVTVHEHFGDADQAKAVRAAIGMREFHDLRDPWLDALLDECYDPYRVSVGAAVAAYAGEPDTAVRLLERSIQLAPREGTYQRQLGKLHYQLKRHEPARRHLEQAVALSPEDADAWSLLVDLLNTVGDDAAMQRALATGLKHCPNSAALRFANGSRLARTGRVGEAIGELRQAQRLKPDEVRPSMELASLFFRQDRVEEGMAEIRRALVAEPGHPLALSILTRHAIETGDEAQARHSLSQLRSLHRLPPEDLATLAGNYRSRFRRDPW